VIAGAVDNCERTEGSTRQRRLRLRLPHRAVVCQDQTNENAGAPNGTQNYKLVACSDVDMAGPAVTTDTTAPVTTPTTAPAVQVPNRSGYWMVGNDGRVYNFGDAKGLR